MLFFPLIGHMRRCFQSVDITTHSVDFGNVFLRAILAPKEVPEPVSLTFGWLARTTILATPVVLLPPCYILLVRSDLLLTALHVAAIGSEQVLDAVSRYVQVCLQLSGSERRPKASTGQVTSFLGFYAERYVLSIGRMVKQRISSATVYRPSGYSSQLEPSYKQRTDRGGRAAYVLPVVGRSAPAPRHRPPGDPPTWQIRATPAPGRKPRDSHQRMLAASNRVPR